MTDNEDMILDGIQFEKDSLIYGSVIKLEELTTLANKNINEIESSDNVRLIVLEAWLFIDYCIREFLLAGLNLSELNVENCDLRFNLLPRSFVDCINLLEKIKKTHQGLPRDPRENSITLPLKFLFILKNDQPELFHKLLDFEQEYYKRYAPELVHKRFDVFSTDPLDIFKNGTEYSRISTVWLAAANRIDDEWIKSAIRLNLARNMSAHSYDQMKISQKMGYTGANYIEHIKSECLSLIEKLVGLKQENNATPV
jgi:hypothetical protein